MPTCCCHVFYSDSYGFQLAVRDAPPLEAWWSFHQSPLHLQKTIRQRERWERLMIYQKDRQIYVFPPYNQTTIKRAIRKGIPEDLRGPAWFFYSGAQAAMAARPHLYGDLVRGSMERRQDGRYSRNSSHSGHSSGANSNSGGGDSIGGVNNNNININNNNNININNNSNINININNNINNKGSNINNSNNNGSNGSVKCSKFGCGPLDRFNTQCHQYYDYTADITESWLMNQQFRRLSLSNSCCPLGAIQRILEAYDIFPDRPSNYAYDPHLCTIVGALLLVVKDEERVFWLLDVIIRERLPPAGFYTSAGLVGQHIGAMVEQQVLLELLHSKLPKLWAKLMDGLGTAGFVMLTAPWMLGLWIGQLPFEWALRVLDVFLVEGSKVLLRIAFALLSLHQEELLEAESSPLQLALIIRSLPARQIDPYRLFEVAFDQIGSLPMAWVERERARAMPDWQARYALRRFSVAAAAPSSANSNRHYPSEQEASLTAIYAPRLSPLPPSSSQQRPVVAPLVVQVNGSSSSSSSNGGGGVNSDGNGRIRSIVQFSKFS